MGLSFGFGKKRETLKISYLDPDSGPTITRHLVKHLKPVAEEREIIFFCIGTDRSTGDALGPLVGSSLCKKNLQHERIFGTLDDPVHAVNLHEHLEQAARKYNNPFVVAVDACLGQLPSVGCIQIADGPLKPGAAVNKQLPPVGNMHITGIVNVSGFMEYFVLQNTRLSQVIHMAEQISESIIQALIQCGRFRSISMPIMNADSQSL